MPKIAFVSQPRDAVTATDMQSGSVTIVLWELATRIARRHDVVVFAPQAVGQTLEEVSPSGVRIRRMPVALRQLHKALDLATGQVDLRTPYFASTAYFREYALSVAHWLKHERPDVVHVQTCSQFLPLFRAAVPTARLFLHAHDEFLSLLPDDLVRSRTQHVTAVITCSDFITRCLRTRLPYLSDRIHTVGNGVNTTYFQARDSSRAPERFRVLFVGRVSPEKGIHTLAAAFAELGALNDRAELEIVGSAGLLPFSQIKLLSGDPHVAALQSFYGAGLWGRIDKQLLHAHTSYWRSVQALIPQPLRNRVHFHGQLSREALKAAYRRADVLAMPSLCMEPFGLPLVEAMATGLPCVASRAGGIPDIVTDNQTGILLERGNVPALTCALRKLALDRATRESMGRLGRQRAEEHFDWSLPAVRLETLYCQQLEATAHRA